MSMERESGCHIVFESDEHPPSGQRMATITGSSTGIERAVSLIQAAVHRAASWSARPAPSGGHYSAGAAPATYAMASPAVPGMVSTFYQQASPQQPQQQQPMYGCAPSPSASAPGGFAPQQHHQPYPPAPPGYVYVACQPAASSDGYAASSGPSSAVQRY